jgi:hypothetical protein
MSTNWANCSNELGPLWEAYQHAFGHWVAQVRDLETLIRTPAGNEDSITRARAHAAVAEAAYRESRDALADFLLASRARARAATS